MGTTKFPAVSPVELLRILRRHCGEPIRIRGSHHLFLSPYNQKRVLLAVHGKEHPPRYVRTLLVVNLGLTEEQALKEVS